MPTVKGPIMIWIAGAGTGLYVAGALVIGNLAQTSRLYHSWVWAGIYLLVLLVSLAAASWSVRVGSPWKGIALSVLMPLVTFSLLLVIAWLLPDAYVVQYPAPVQLENYDVAIPVIFGGMAALAAAPVLAGLSLVLRAGVRRKA